MPSTSVTRLRTFCAGLLAAAATLGAPAAWGAPTLVGDVVTIGRYIDGNPIGDGLCCGPFPVLVQAGAADLTSVSLGNNIFVNPEADHIVIQFGPGGGSGGGLPDHEILIQDLDWIDAPGARLTGFTLSTNFGSVNDSMVRFGDHFIGLQMGGLDWGGTEGYFVDLLLANDGGNVPEPLTLALVGLGLAGLGASRRRGGASRGAGC